MGINRKYGYTTSNGQEIPIIADEYVDMSKSTGAVK